MAGRKPINLEMKGLKTNRQRIWEAIRAEAKGFTGQRVATRAKVDIFTVRSYLRALIRAGYIEQSEDSKLPEKQTLRLTRDCGAEAPAVTRDGKPSTAGRGSEAMWRTLRILGEVSAEELASQASIAIKTTVWTARTYLKWLHRAGYVLEVVPAKAGRKGQRARYRLASGKYTGPKPPMIQRHGQVFDPNLGRVVYVHNATTGAEA